MIGFRKIEVLYAMNVCIKLLDIKRLLYLLGVQQIKLLIKMLAKIRLNIVQQMEVIVHSDALTLTIKHIFCILPP